MGVARAGNSMAPSTCLLADVDASSSNSSTTILATRSPSHATRGETSGAAIIVFDKVVAAQGVSQRLLTDNGSALNPTRQGFSGRLVDHVRALGVEAITGKPYKPTTQGKNERLHQTLFSPQPWHRVRRQRKAPWPTNRLKQTITEGGAVWTLESPRVAPTQRIALGAQGSCATPIRSVRSVDVDVDGLQSRAGVQTVGSSPVERLNRVVDGGMSRHVGAVELRVWAAATPTLMGAMAPARRHTNQTANP